VVVVAQGRSPNIVPLKGNWRKRYRELMFGLVRKDYKRRSDIEGGDLIYK